MTAIALVLLFAPPLWVASPAAAAPGGPWGVPSLLPGTPDTATGTLALASDRSGTVFAVYDHYNGTSYAIFANRYVMGFGWTGPVQISNRPGAQRPSVATDARGDAFVAWMEYNATLLHYTPAYAFYATEIGWLAPSNFSDNSSIYFAQFTAVAMDGIGGGYYVASFYNASTTIWNVMAARADIGGSSTTIQYINDLYNSTSGPAVAGNPLGGALVVMDSYNNTNFVSDVVAVQYTMGSGWGPLTPLETTTNYAYLTNVGFDDSGQALATWYQYNNGNYNQYARWNSTSGWSAAAGFGGSNYLYDMDLGVAPSGAATLAGYTWNGSGYNPIAFAYTPALGWSAGARAPDPVYYGSRPVRVAVDRTGSAVVAWLSIVGNLIYVHGAEFGVAGWGNVTSSATPEPLSFNSTNVQVAGQGHGRAMVAWSDYNGANYRGWVNRFISSADLLPPWVSITSPYNGSSFGTGATPVTGYSEPGSQVSVNGFTAVTFPDGRFEVSVPLGEGYNTIQARAVDDAGNAGYSTLRFVTQTDPSLLIAAERAQAGRVGWQDVMKIENLSRGNAWWPTIRSDPSGNAFLVWYEWDGVGYSAYVNRYSMGIGWGTPMLLRGFEYANLYDPANLAVDSLGNAVVAWTQYNYSGGVYSVWSQTWLSATRAWSAPMRLDNATTYAYSTDIAVSNDNRFLVVWNQFNNSFNYGLWAQFFSPSTGWGARTRLSDPGNYTYYPRVTFNGSGGATVTGTWYSSGNYSVVLYQHTVSTGWSGARILVNRTGISSQISVRADAGGNLTMAWLEASGSVYNLVSGRIINGTFQGVATLWNDSWTWVPEIIVDGLGYAYVAETATVNGTPDALTWVAPPGQPFGPAFHLDNLTGWGGGPRLSLTSDGLSARAHWDENEGVIPWRANMRLYNHTTSTWGAVVRMSPEYQKANIPDVAPMPDGGYIVAWLGNDPVLGIDQIQARRFIPPETVPPILTVTSPTEGSVLTTTSVRVAGLTEPGAYLTINSIIVDVAPNGTFAFDLPLTNGSNVITVVARDAVGNTNTATRTVTFDNPDRRRIEQLEAQNAALQNQLNLTNASLTAALAAQNASLLGQIAGLNASLIAKLGAQNTSLLGAIATLNSSLLASLAAQNASLAQLIGSVNSSLLAQLAATNSSLLGQIAALNSTLLADLAAQNGALLATIAATNASLFGQLVAQNASLTQALAGVNLALLASLAAQNTSLANLIASTNASLLASLAAQNASLTSALAGLNTTLLASLAAQNDALLSQIAMTNASLLLELARTNSTLWARLTAENGALWTSLNASRAEQQAADAGINSNLNGTNTNLGKTQNDVSTAQQAAQSATTMALLGLLVGLVGIAIAAVAFTMGRKGGRPAMELAGASAPSEEVHAQVDVQGPGGPGKG